MITNKICEEKDCTGCSACASICPKGCISMNPDKEGFLRPEINPEICIQCGKCEKVCPINNPFNDDGIEPKTFAVRHIDDGILKQSSSGGLFSAFSETVLKSGGIVIGAGFDNDFSVIHKICDNIKDLDELKKSKYVQSRIGNIYKITKELLDSGKKVLFCGTPCQVGGVKSFLGAEYPNFFTVDFICHGIPSPLAWKKYLDYKKESANSKIDSIIFRCKDFGWKNHSLKFIYKNGEQQCQKITDDFYLCSFIKDMNLRPSCYNCKFKQVHRLSDVTMADFWGAEKFIDKWNDDKGISLAFIHSDNGNKLLNDSEDLIDKIPVNYCDGVADNPSMTSSVSEQPLRKYFMRDIKRIRYDKLYDKYCGNSLQTKLRGKTIRFIEKLGNSK